MERLELKKSALEKNRPLSISVLNKLRDDLSIEWTYNSNSIEGNSLTLIETKVVLEDGITIGGKSLKEHFEVINHQRAIEYLEELVSKNISIRSIDILSLHGLVMKHIDDDFAGRIRNGMVRISGANFTPPGPTECTYLLDELIDFVNNNPLNLDMVTLAAIFHHRLVWIHPFFDGNGRTGRLALNLLLMKYGYPPAIILRNDRKKYYDALNLANRGDYTKILLLVVQALERSLNIYLNTLPGEYDSYVPLTDIANDPEVPYGMEYISLLARRGTIDAHKEGKNWMSTKKAVLKHYQGKKL